MEKFADLHMHSSHSDSDFSIEKIFQVAKDKGLSCISVTDHDTVNGAEEACVMSARYGVEFLSGIEISAQINDTEVHVLGYMVDHQDTKLLRALDSVEDIRKERLLGMSSKLNDLGMKVDNDEFFNGLKGAMPTRLHLALYMVDKQYVKSVSVAFKKYLSPGNPAYVSRFRYSVKDSIKIIKDSGGLAFLAHPHFLPKDESIKKFVDWGIDGMEVRYPGYSAERTEYFSKLVDKYNLLKSGGSDAHGSFKDFTSIGEVKIPYEWVNKMKDVNSVPSTSKQLSRS